MRKLLFVLLLCIPALKAFSQSSSIRGTIKDENNAVLSYAPVVLLHPADSTLAFFGVTNDHGFFEIKSARNGKYILQATLMGHKPYFREIVLPVGGTGDVGTIVMKSAPIALKEVTVSEEHTTDEV